VTLLPPALEISLLGPPRVLRDGEPVAFDTRKATALLAHLALAGRPRSREALCELLWPEQDPDHARGALRRTLSTLRKAVGEEWLETAGDSVALLDGPGLRVDVRRFRALARGGAGELADAVEVYRGELLEGFYVRDSPGFDAWYQHEADTLQRELGSALGRLVRALTEGGEYGAAIRHARRWLALDPLHEPAHRALIRLYALDGDRAAALAQYRDCVRTLSQELGVPPVDETAALFEQISEGTLVAPAPAAPVAPPPAVPPAELPLVGRAVELAALARAYAAARPDGALAVIEGEAGIGKSRLARELIATAGGTVLSARCHEDEAGLPYGPIVDLLGDAARTGLLASVAPQRRADASLLAPELATPELPPPMEMSGPAAQARLLDAVASVLGVADLIFVDDVHAADEATLDVLAYLARRLRGRALLLLLAWRSDSVPPGHRLRRLEGAVLGLGRLDAAQVSELVRSRAVAPDIEHRIYEESEGLPLLVAEYLAAMDEGGQPGREMRDLVAGRIAGLGATARQLIETAAVIGRTFTFDLVRAASGRGDDETTDGLDEIVGRGLVRELDAGYDFTHGKLRELVYEQTGRARRRLLHRRVADALLRSGGAPATAAQHLRQAGDDAGAAEQHRIAAEHAASVLAFGDALDHLDAALELGAPVHERMGDLRTLVGDYAGALASYEAAAASSDDVARVEHKLGGVYQRRGEWDRAQARYTVALEACDDEALRARIRTDLSLTLHLAGDHERAAREALAVAESASDRQALAQAHNVLGTLAREQGRLDAARAEFERSLTLADGPGRAAALNNLALVARESGETGLALDLTLQALALCVTEGDRHREAALENNLADLYHAAGRIEESMEHQLRAVAIFSDVGGDERTRLPEIWKLVSW
jgi:DNA-binding SARP family transcriptional activator